MARNSGTTSQDAGHIHEYQVDANGNGWAYEAYHPDESRIFHKHKITNWVVESAQSGCYPNCESMYGVKGAPPHIHQLQNSNNSSKYNSGGINPGGMLYGPTHEQGGIAATVGGNEQIELEGGEYIINAQTVNAVGEGFLNKLNSTSTTYHQGGYNQGQLPAPSMYAGGGKVRNRRNKMRKRTAPVKRTGTPRKRMGAPVKRTGTPRKRMGAPVKRTGRKVTPKSTKRLAKKMPYGGRVGGASRVARRAPGRSTTRRPPRRNALRASRRANATPMRGRQGFMGNTARKYQTGGSTSGNSLCPNETSLNYPNYLEHSNGKFYCCQNSWFDQFCSIIDDVNFIEGMIIAQPGGVTVAAPWSYRQGGKVRR